MGLLDDMGPLLKGKPKTMPGLPGDNLDFGMGLPPIGDPPPIPTGGPNALLKQEMTPGPNRITPTMASTEAPRGMDYGLGDTGFGGDVRQMLAKPPGGGISEPQRRGLVTAATDMDFGLGDKGFGKNPARLAEGLPMTPPEPSPSMPTPGSGLLANVPLPPSRPAGLGGMPPTRSAASMPLPPPRPAGLGGAAEVASTTAPPMPPIRPPDLDVASAAPPIAPIAPPIAAASSAPQAPVGGAAGGAMGGLGGIASAIGKIAGAFNKPGPPPPQAKAPQITPSSAGPETSQQQAKASAQAPQILQGLLAQDKQDTLDPRKRRMA